MAVLESIDFDYYCQFGFQNLKILLGLMTPIRQPFWKIHSITVFTLSLADYAVHDVLDCVSNFWMNVYCCLQMNVRECSECSEYIGIAL